AEVFVLDMGQPVKIDDLARDLIKLSGLEPEKDVKIVYTGIRPGEKLYEELLTSEEGTAGTKHNRIYIGKSTAINFDVMREMIDNFERLTKLESVPNPQIVQVELVRWIPTYHPLDYSRKETKESISQALKASLEVVASLENR